MSHLRFKNELGNDITAKVWTTGPDEEKEGYRLTYSLEGPTSETVNTMTESEAMALHALLSLALFAEPLPAQFEKMRVSG